MEERQWYENTSELADAINFLLKYNCCFDWNVFASEKTPCCDYTELDSEIPKSLKENIRSYIRSLSENERQKLDDQLCCLLGERFYVTESTIVKVLSRMMSDGNPRDHKDIMVLGLLMQTKQRIDLLEELMGS